MGFFDKLKAMFKKAAKEIGEELKEAGKEMLQDMKDKALDAAEDVLDKAKESIKTGVAPVYATALAVAMNVRLGRITSSPGPIPRVTSARCKAAVPLLVAMAYFTSQN